MASVVDMRVTRQFVEDRGAAGMTSGIAARPRPA
jgi:hypothetical protein